MEKISRILEILKVCLAVYKKYMKVVEVSIVKNKANNYKQYVPMQQF